MKRSVRSRRRRRSAPTPASPTSAGGDRVADHVRRTLGPVRATLAGNRVGVPGIRLLLVPPGRGRDFHTLVTSGMSARPMRVDDARCGCSPYAELTLRLAREWLSDPRRISDPRTAAPLEDLMHMAALPQRQDTHLGCGHTVTTVAARPASEPRSGFGGWVFRPTDWAPASFRELRLNRQDTVAFLGATALYPDELYYAVARGSAALLDLMDRADLSDRLQPGRPSLVSGLAEDAAH